MENITKYSLVELLNAYKENKPLIDAYIKGQSIEGKSDSDTAILGIGLSIFFIILLINLVLFVVALVLLIKYWKFLPDWAKVLGVLGFFFPMGAVMTIVVVMIGKKN
jgi:hypothetical protein